MPYVPSLFCDARSISEWSDAWSAAEQWHCPDGHVRLVYDPADADVARRLIDYHIRSAHQGRLNHLGDFTGISLWVTLGRSMDCYIITENTHDRIAALPDRDYANCEEAVSILSSPSDTWWRNRPVEDDADITAMLG